MNLFHPRHKFMRKLALLLVLTMVNMMVLPYVSTEASAAEKPKLERQYTYSYVGTSNIYKLLNLEEGYTVKWRISNEAKGYASFSKKDSMLTTKTVAVEGSSSEVKVYASKKAKSLLNKSYLVSASVYDSKGKLIKVASDWVKFAQDAAEVTINNFPVSKTMSVGDSFDFNRTLTPKKSVNKTYWTVMDENEKLLLDTKSGLTSSKAKMTSKGVFTPLEAGTYLIGANVYRSKNATVLRASAELVKIIVTAPAPGPSPTPIPSPTPTPTPSVTPYYPPVTTAPTPIPESISITVDQYSAGQVYEVTSDTITLTGKIETNTGVKESKVSYYSSSNEEVRTIAMEGTNPFTISSLPLDIGTNYINISASATNGTSATVDLVIQRASTEITFGENVIAFDPSTEEGISEISQIFLSIEDYWLDDKGTPEDTDDEYLLVLTEDSPLLVHIRNGVYEEGDIIYIPKCEFFPSGLSLIYRSHDDAYPADRPFDASLYEMLHTQIPSLLDLINDEICYNSAEIDINDPFAFMLFPEGTDLYLEDEEGENEQLLVDTDIYSNFRFLAGNEPVQGKGFQFQNLSKLIIPTADFSDINDGSIKFKFSDVILYDKDGKKETENDQVKLGGEMGLKEIKPTLGLEWHPTITDPLPKQFISKISYKEVRNLKVEFGAEFASLEDIVKDYQKRLNGFKNENSFAGITLQGVNMDSTIVLGAVGINLAGVQVANIRTIQSASILVPFNPTLIIFLCIDLKGNLSTQVTFELENTAYVEKGVNIQKDGFVGRYGSCASNMGSRNYTFGNRNINIYDVYAKSKYERNLLPVSKLKISAEGTASVSASVGAAIGVMIAGVIPAYVKGSIGPKATATLKGKLTLSSDAPPELEGEASLNLQLLAKVVADIRLKAKTFLGNPGFEGHYDIAEYIFLEYNLSTTALTGKVYASDNDRDNSNNPILPGAKLTLTRKNASPGSNSYYFETTTGADGSYRIGNIAAGNYILEVSMDGFKTYRDEDFEIKSTGNEKSIYLDSAVQTSGLSGIITEADTDTIASNNLPLAGIPVKLTKLGSSMSPLTTVTDENGKYSFTNLPRGLYEIYVSDDTHIAVTSEILIQSDGATVYNIALEAISNSYLGSGIASGTIHNALNGRGVEAGLSLYVYRGYNTSGGAFVSQTSTGAEGKYSLELAAGNYTVYVIDERTEAGTRYHSGSFNIKVLGNTTIGNQNGEVTPILAVDEIRIVLAWGETPYDLDSHITGPADGASRFHVYYSNQNYYEAGILMCNLDVDDTSSYGPETITIYKQSDGIYRYAIHDYSNRNSSSSMALANSGAYVRVYIESSHGSEVRSYYVPHLEGTVWNVFEYDSVTGTFTDLNTMEYIYTPSNVATQDSNRSMMASRMVQEPELKDYEKEAQNQNEEADTSSEGDVDNTLAPVDNSDITGATDASNPSSCNDLNSSETDEGNSPTDYEVPIDYDTAA